MTHNPPATYGRARGRRLLRSAASEVMPGPQASGVGHDGPLTCVVAGERSGLDRGCARRGNGPGRASRRLRPHGVETFHYIIKAASCCGSACDNTMNPLVLSGGLLTTELSGQIAGRPAPFWAGLSCSPEAGLAGWRGSPEITGPPSPPGGGLLDGA